MTNNELRLLIDACDKESNRKCNRFFKTKKKHLQEMYINEANILLDLSSKFREQFFANLRGEKKDE